MHSLPFQSNWYFTRLSICRRFCVGFYLYTLFIYSFILFYKKSEKFLRNSNEFVKLYHIFPASNAKVLERHLTLFCKYRRFQMFVASTSYTNGFGEALTTQPRSSRGNNSIHGMDLSYVTERIISVWFPAGTNSHSYRQGQRQAAHMLMNKHGDNYMVSLDFCFVSMSYFTAIW